MSIAQTQRSLSRYFSSRDRLSPILKKIRDNLADSAIFGGMIRDFGLGDAREFKSDIDIVTMSSSKEIFALIKDYDPQRNKFGGFRFFVEKQMFDIWSFEDTWAFKEGIIKGEKLEDICRTTFFNADAAIYKLNESKILNLSEFYFAISERILDINLEHNPNPEKMVNRTIKMVVNKNMGISTRLAQFIIDTEYKNCYLEKSFKHLLARHLYTTPEDPFYFNPQLSLLFSKPIKR